MKGKAVRRTTKTKAKVEEILIGTKVPLSLHQLHVQVIKSLPATAYSTVFRIIQKLEEEGLVSKVNWKDRGGTYEWSNRPHHHHVVCERCENIEDIDDDAFSYNETKLRKDTGYIITNHTIEFMGICKPCQKKK